MGALEGTYGATSEHEVGVRNLTDVELDLVLVLDDVDLAGDDAALVAKDLDGAQDANVDVFPSGEQGGVSRVEYFPTRSKDELESIVLVGSRLDPPADVHHAWRGRASVSGRRGWHVEWGWLPVPSSTRTLTDVVA